MESFSRVKTVVQQSPVRNSDGSWAKCKRQKPDRYPEYLENTFQPNEGDIILDWKHCVGPEGNIKHNSPKEVAQEIKENVKPKEAPGCDLITMDNLQQKYRRTDILLTPSSLKVIRKIL